MRRFARRDRLGTGFGRQTGECFGSTRVGNEHLMAKSTEQSRQRPTDGTCTNDTYFHRVLLIKDLC